MDPLAITQIGYRHLGENPFHYDADLLLGGKSSAASRLGPADRLARRLSASPASPARGQGCFSLFASKLLLPFVWNLLIRQFFVHGSRDFLRILAPVGVNPKLDSCSVGLLSIESHFSWSQTAITRRMRSVRSITRRSHESRQLVVHWTHAHRNVCHVRPEKARSSSMILAGRPPTSSWLTLARTRRAA